MKRSILMGGWVVVALAGIVACSSSETGVDRTQAEGAARSSEALAVAACVSPPGGPCGGFTQNPCTCAPGSKCIPNPVPDIPGTCVVCDPIRCPAGETWDRATCSCVPECTTATDCHGPLPQLCKICPEGGAGCAHWTCVSGVCEVAFCP